MAKCKALMGSAVKGLIGARCQLENVTTDKALPVEGTSVVT